MSYLLIVALVGLTVWFAKSLTVIPAGFVAIEEKLGQASRVLSPGWYIVPWPISCLRRVRWTYFDQKNELKVFAGNMFSWENSQMDIPPISCPCKDRIQITLDATVMYRIIDPKKAVYQTDDVMNLFYQGIQQSVIHVVSKFSYEELLETKHALAEQIIVEVKKTVDPAEYGVTITKFVVQELKTSSEIFRKSEEMHARLRQNKLRIQEVEANLAYEKAKIRADDTLTTAKLEAKLKKEEKVLALELLKTQAEAKRRTLTTDSEWKGFTVAERIEMERVKVLQEIAKNQQNTIYAPLEYWTRPGFVEKLK